jgi:hypothetical protein
MAHRSQCGTNGDTKEVSGDTISVIEAAFGRRRDGHVRKKTGLVAEQKEKGRRKSGAL